MLWMNLSLVNCILSIIQSLRTALLQSFFISLALALSLSIITTRYLVTPLKKMKTASQQIARGDYQERLKEEAAGELGELAKSFKTMAATLALSKEQRLELMRNYAHEFRTPLSTLQGNIQGISDGVLEANNATLDACLRQVSRLIRLLEDLTLLSKVESGEITINNAEFALNTTIKNSIGMLQNKFDAKGVMLE